MFRLIRRSASVFVVLFALGAVEAQAGSSYLFRLTAEDIDAVMSYYYPKGYDRDAVHRQMSAPFDCRNFGDLCREVGEDYAYQIVEGAWSKAKRKTPIEMIGRAAEEQFEDLGLRWFERLYPDGVDARDPYWGVFAEPGGSTECTDTVTADSGDFRMVQTARRHTLVVYAWGRLKAEHFKKNISGKYKPAKADRLQVSGTVFIQEASFAPVPNPISDTKDDAKQVAASHREGGITIVAVPFVEGCGGVSNNSTLFACTCSGELPFGF